MFTHELGQPIAPDRLSTEFSRIVKRAGLPKLSLHPLRHLQASVLLDGGMNIKGVSERLGHADPALTLRVYSHLMPGLQERAAEILDRRLGKWERIG